MHLLTPLWLLLFLPWLALVVWLCIGRPPRAVVPFAQLWPHDQAVSGPERKVRAPPISILLMLMAAGAALIAAAGPIVERRITGLPTESPRGRVVILVDRGLSVATYAQPVRPFTAAAARLDRLLPANLGLPIELQPVPGKSVILERAEAAAAISELRPTMLETDGALAVELGNVERDPQVVAIVVVSDRVVPDLSDRAVRVSVDSGDEACWIARAGARRGPQNRVLVRIEWTGAARRTALTISSGGTITRQVVSLGDANRSVGQQTVIVDVPALGSVITIQLDDSPLAKYWLTENSPWPDVRLSGGTLPEGVARFAVVYRRDRPPQVDSPAVTVGPSIESLGSASGIACIEASSANAAASVTPHRLIVADHPITRGIDFTTIESMALAEDVSGTLPAPGWQTILSAGDAVLIAVREGDAGATQVRIRLTGEQWSALAREPAFVHLMAAAFSWCGRVSDPSVGYREQSLPDVSDARRMPEILPISVSADMRGLAVVDGPVPGVYREDDGGEIALNAVEPPEPEQFRVPLGIGPIPEFRPMSDFRPLLALLAIALIGVALIRS
jgi:hypothetical protein